MLACDQAEVGEAATDNVEPRERREGGVAAGVEELAESVAALVLGLDVDRDDKDEARLGDWRRTGDADIRGHSNWG